MTGESNDYKIDVSKIKGMAKFSQSVNGQSLLTVEIAIPFEQLGYIKDNKTGTTVNKWGNYYNKMGIEKPLGKRTLMQFDSAFDYTSDNDADKDTETLESKNIGNFYYYVDAAEFGYIIQMAPEGRSYQDLSYTDGDGYSTISSVRGEVLNTQNGKEIEYNPDTFEISTIHTTNNDPVHAAVKEALNEREAFRYVEEDGRYHFTSQLDTNRVINQGGTISTKLTIPKGGSYFSFDWRVQSETSDTLSVWVEQTETWEQYYKAWIDGYNCGVPYRKSNAKGIDSIGIIDYSSDNITMHSTLLADGGLYYNNMPLMSDACVGFISGYKDTTRNPENFVLASWKDRNLSTSSDALPVNIGDVVVYSPLVGGELSVDNGMYRHVWDWNNVTIWIPNTSDADVEYTVTWMYWKNGSQHESYNASDGRGTDDAQITNFRLSTTEELGYWKTSKNWDTLRLDSNVVDPSDTALGIKELAKNEANANKAISTTENNLLGATAEKQNTFGTNEFVTLSYAAVAKEEAVGTTAKAMGYVETKDKIQISAANIPVEQINNYKNNAIVFTQDYTDDITRVDPLLDWTVLEFKYNTASNTWTLSRLFEEQVDKQRFNIHPDDNTIIVLVNYTYDGSVTANYGETQEAVLFGYANREVLKLLTPEIRYTRGENNKITETLAKDKNVKATQFFISNIFIRENYNIARGKTYSLRHYPTYSDSTYMYTENWFRENNTEDALAAFLAVYSETPLYYVNDNGEVPGTANTDGDYSKAFEYKYSSGQTLRFDTNRYSDMLYVPAGVGQLTDGDKLSVYSNSYHVEALEDYAIGYFVQDTMGTPDAATVESIYPNDTVYSHEYTADSKHNAYTVNNDINTREENVILDLGAVEYGLSAFTARFAGGGEDGVTFPTSVDFSISSDGLSYYYIGSVALDDIGYNSTKFEDAYASIIYTGATDTVYGNTLADYTFDLRTVGVTARYIKATIMNHSAENAKMFISEFTATQNAIVPDGFPQIHASSWVDVSDDATLMYQDDELRAKYNNIYNQPYSFVTAPTTAGYLFADDKGYADDGRANVNTNELLTGQLTDGIGGSTLIKATDAVIDADAAQWSVGWMKAYTPEVSLSFKFSKPQANVGYVAVYALHSLDSVDKVTMPYNVTAYVGNETSDGKAPEEWTKVATVNAKDNDSDGISLKGVDLVRKTEKYEIYKYTLAFARDGELAKQLNGFDYAKIVCETDGGEDGWICLTEVEVYNGHECFPVYDLTDGKYKKITGLGSIEAERDSEVRPTFFRGFYDTYKYYDEIKQSTVHNGHPGQDYDPNMVFNNNVDEADTLDYVYANVEQRAVDGRGTPYFYSGDQLLLRVTNNELNADGYSVQGQWRSSYKLSAESKLYFNDVVSDTVSNKTQLFTTTAVPTPQTVCNVLARPTRIDPSNNAFANVPNGMEGLTEEQQSKAYYYLPIYMMNTLDYLKYQQFKVEFDSDGGNAGKFINMPANKVEITGTVVWDTNESDTDEPAYKDDRNGVSLNIAPLGAKTNITVVNYNGNDYSPEATIRFGSIWYIDDAAYYYTHTHRQQYGTVLVTIPNLARYLTDTLNAKYKSAFDDYGIKLQKLEKVTVLDKVREVTGLTEVKKLTGVTELVKLTGVEQIMLVESDDKYTYTTTDANGQTKYWYVESGEKKKVAFTFIKDRELTYWGCDDQTIDVTGTGEGHVWLRDIEGSENKEYWYCSDKNVYDYKFTTGEGDSLKYWYCNESISKESGGSYWVGPDENDVESYWYCESESQSSSDNVKYQVLADGRCVYYIDPNAETKAFTEVKLGVDHKFAFTTTNKDGSALYWNYDKRAGDDWVASWTFTADITNATGEKVTEYYYAPNFDGIAGTVIPVTGENGEIIQRFATSEVGALQKVIATRDKITAREVEPRYWTAKTEEAFNMLTKLKETVTMDENGNPATTLIKGIETNVYDNDGNLTGAQTYNATMYNEEQIQKALDIYLEYVNKYGEQRYGEAGAGLTFGGLASNVRANKYYYFCYLSDELAKPEYDADKDGIFQKPDSTPDTYNKSEPEGLNRFDQRYIEFDAILAGIPVSQKSTQIIAIPYAIYANNYEFLEFGEVIGKDYYVKDTWKDVFNDFYGDGNEANNMRRYVYGKGVIRSVQDVLDKQEKPRQ